MGECKIEGCSCPDHEKKLVWPPPDLPLEFDFEELE